MRDMIIMGGDYDGMTDKTRAVRILQTSLMNRLTDAVLRRDAAAADKAFDAAFWQRVDIKPEHFHLFVALLHGERAMVKLLLQAGATLDENEARFTFAMLKESRDNLKPLLRRHSIRTAFPAKELETPDPQMEITLLMRWKRECEERGIEAKYDDRDITELAADRLNNLMSRGDFNAAADLVRASTDKELIDMTDEVRSFTEKSPEKAIMLVDTLIERGAKITIDVPAALRGLPPENIAPVLKALRQHGLSGDEALVRADYIGSWLDVAYLDQHRRREDVPAYIQQATETTRRYAQHAADILSGGWAIPAEAAVLWPVFDKRFLDNALRVAAREGDERAIESLALTEKIIENLATFGYFESPAFTVEQMKTLADACHVGNDALRWPLVRKQILTDGFNGYLAARKDALPHLAEILEKPLLIPDLQQTADICDYLFHKQYKGTAGDDDPAVRAAATQISKIIDRMVAIGADFRALDAAQFIRGDDPGMAEMLLTSGAVTARDFMLDTLRAKTKGRIDLYGEKRQRMTDFYAMVVMQNINPEKYAGRFSGHNYRELLMREMRRAGESGSDAGALDYCEHSLPKDPPPKQPAPAGTIDVSIYDRKPAAAAAAPHRSTPYKGSRI